ncbi:MAG: DsbE family thiol:disulfide interchange protein [Pseudomonadota bacterium]
MKIKILAYLPLIIVVVLVGYFYKALYEDASLIPSALVGKPMPEFNLPLLKTPEQTVSKADILGDYFLLNVWATWCPSCYQEHPALIKLAQQYDVKIVGLNYKDERNKALRYLKQYKDPYRFVLFDEPGRFAIELGVYGAPETYLIDPQGEIIYRHVGVVTMDTWNEIFKPRIEKHEQQKMLEKTS